MRRTVILALPLLFVICFSIGAEKNRKDAAAFICKFCGREVRSSAGGKLTFQGSDVCKAAQNGKHILLPVHGHCVYCGRLVQVRGGVLVYNGSNVCSVSPIKKHSLQD